MANRGAPKRSSLGLIVLWQLFEGPMHVYRMQKMFEAQGKDRVVNVRSRASLYQTIERLERHGLVEVYETRRAEGYPDRVVYAITDEGRDVAREWLREMLRDTEGEYPEFIAAVSILFGPAREDARAELELRAEKLRLRSWSRNVGWRTRRQRGCRVCSCSKRSTARRCSRPSSRGSAA